MLYLLCMLNVPVSGSVLIGAKKYISTDKVQAFTKRGGVKQADKDFMLLSPTHVVESGVRSFYSF